ncbi:MAG: thioredoxin family protein [Acidobacteria bacterium]|nr:thioredoxin family protein [Acidobacteriota bacterium]
MKNIFSKPLLSFLVFAAVAVSAYFINVEVQSYLGRETLKRTGLVSLPLDKAKIKAKSENKHILVDVSAIWCANCRRLDSEIFADEDVKRVINERFVFSRLEYESDEGQNFLEKHKAAGFPNLWLLDGDGRVVKRLSVTFDKGEFLWQLYR